MSHDMRTIHSGTCHALSIFLRRYRVKKEPVVNRFSFKVISYYDGVLLFTADRGRFPVEA